MGLLGFGGLRDVEQSLEESSDLSRLGAGAILRALLYQVINDYLRGRRAAPSLRPGQVMGMDNLSSHNGSRVRELIEQRGCELIYLPPYSRSQSRRGGVCQDKGATVRKARARTREALIEAMGRALEAVTAMNARGFFEHRGYRATAQLL